MINKLPLIGRSAVKLMCLEIIYAKNEEERSRAYKMYKNFKIFGYFGHGISGVFLIICVYLFHEHLSVIGIVSNVTAGSIGIMLVIYHEILCYRLNKIMSKNKYYKSNNHKYDLNVIYTEIIFTIAFLSSNIWLPILK